MKKGDHITEETREKMSESKKGEKNYNFGKHLPEETRKKISESVKKTKSTEEQKRKMSKINKGEGNGMYGKHHTAESKEKVSITHKKENLSAETLKKMSDSQKKRKSFTNIHRERLSDSHKKENLSVETRKKMSESQMGEKNHNYINGNSNKYCSLFNEKLKEKIREKFDRKCFLCGLNEEQNGRKLSVHHISYNKDCLCDGKECYFIPLCDSCHTKTNFNREFYEIFLTRCCKYPGVMGY